MKYSFWEIPSNLSEFRLCFVRLPFIRGISLEYPLLVYSNELKLICWCVLHCIWWRNSDEQAGGGLEGAIYLHKLNELFIKYLTIMHEIEFLIRRRIAETPLHPLTHRIHKPAWWGYGLVCMWRHLEIEINKCWAREWEEQNLTFIKLNSLEITEMRLNL